MTRQTFIMPSFTSLPTHHDHATKKEKCTQKELSKRLFWIALTCIALVIAIGVACPSKTIRGHRGRNKRRGRRLTPRNLGGGETQAGEEGGAHDAIRMGSCENVPYGNATWPLEVDPRDMPLNELMIHLDHPVYVSPPNPDGPVIVDIGLYVYGVSELDAGSNTFFMEGYIDLVWCDSRVKFEPAWPGQQHLYLEGDAAKELEEIWWPAFTFVNEVHKRDIENQEVIVSADGTVEYREKFGVKLQSNFVMDNFPFDTQVLIAEIESFAWNSSIMKFHIEQDLIGFSEEFVIPEHELTGIDEHLETKQELRDRYPFSELVTELYVERVPTYYVTKVIVPLTLIVMISWAVFWMDCDDLASRMGISFTGVLTSVAYQFVVSESLPRHIYNTWLDNFVLLSFVMMMLTVFVNIIVNVLERKGEHYEARLADKICRVLFPLTFVLSTFVLLLVHKHIEDLPDGGAIGIVLAVMVGIAIIVGVIAFSMQAKKRQRILLDAHEGGYDNEVYHHDLEEKEKIERVEQDIVSVGNKNGDEEKKNGISSRIRTARSQSSTDAWTSDSMSSIVGV